MPFRVHLVPPLLSALIAIPWSIQAEPLLRAVPVEAAPEKRRWFGHERPTRPEAGPSQPLPSAPPTGPAMPLVPIPSHWKPVASLSDEFNSPGVDPAKWETNPGSWGPWSWDPANVSQSGGRLALRMVHEPHTRKDLQLFYKSGIVRSREEITVGYFEARIKGCPTFPGASPAFWLYSLGDRPGRVSYCEVDVVELQQDSRKVRRPAVMDFNLHGRVRDAAGALQQVGPSTNPALCAHQWKAPFDPRKGYHVYSAVVTTKHITWYVDGLQVATADNLNWHLPMRMVLSLGLRDPHVKESGGVKSPVPKKATSKGFPTAMEVDYVRVWAPSEKVP
jgi:beta-glucanase (GH16 family)